MTKGAGKPSGGTPMLTSKENVGDQPPETSKDSKTDLYISDNEETYQKLTLIVYFS